MNKKYIALSLMAAFAVVAMTFGTLSFAQTTTLSCNVGASSVAPNQSVVLTATGGNGTYVWSGPNLNITNNGGNQFSVSYSSVGSYPITVTSAGQSATCNVNVMTTGTPGALSCFPQTQNVILGNSAAVTATGGNGTYVWSSPDLNITNANGSGFSANFASTGSKTLTVTSGGLTTSCTVNVLAVTTPPTTTPGLPNTGGGYGK